MVASNKYMPLVDWSLIEATAPGSLVVSGEFADLYEKSAIAMALDCRLKVTIKQHEEGRLRLNLKNFDNIREWPITSFTMTKLVAKYADIIAYTDTMPQRLNHLLHKRYYKSELPEEFFIESQTDSKIFNSKSKQQQADDGTMAFLLLYVAIGDSYARSARPSLDIEIESDIPINRGMSSSSAYSVALCAALLKVFRISAEPLVIVNWAANIDRFFHGVTSGLTTSAIVHGGYIFYQNNKVKYHGISHTNPIKVMLVDTGVRRDCRQINRQLAEHLKKDTYRTNKILSNIHELTAQIWRLLNDPQFMPRTIGQYINQHHTQLEALGVGHNRISDICNRGTMFNLYAKQSRSGETAFLFYDNKLEKVKEFRVHLEELGYEVEDHDLSHDGLQVLITKKH